MFPVRATFVFTERSPVPKTETIRARIEPELKSQAEALFSQLGLSATQAIRLFYKQATLQRGRGVPLRGETPQCGDARSPQAGSGTRGSNRIRESGGPEGSAPLIRAATHDEAVRKGRRAERRGKDLVVGRAWIYCYKTAGSSRDTGPTGSPAIGRGRCDDCAARSAARSHGLDEGYGSAPGSRCRQAGGPGAPEAGL